MKHIEQITSEQTIGEINRLALSDDMLTTALSKPYADATGLGEVQPSAPVTSDVEEMPSWMTYLLRKIFGTTTRVFRGASLLSEFRAVYSWLRERLKGSADGTIHPVVLEPSKPMSEHLRLLDSRKIDDGLTIKLADGTTTSSPDGLSLAQLLCSDLAVTEMHDTNKGWTMTKRLPYYKNLHSITIGCKEIAGLVDEIRDSLFYCTGEFRADELESCSALYYNVDLLNGGSGDTLMFPKLHSFYAGTYGSMIVNSDYRRIILPALKNFHIGNRYYNIEALVRNSNLEILECPVLYGCATANAIDVNLIANNPNLRYVDLRGFTTKNINIVRNCPNLTTLILGTIIEWSAPNKGDAAYHEFEKEVNLIHLELGEGSKASIQLPYWSPTTALAERLPEFLSNFQTYIADRVADMTGKTALTLTLSPAVYAALEAQNGQTILATLTSKNWTVASA